MYCWFTVYFLRCCWSKIHFDHIYFWNCLIRYLSYFLSDWIRCSEYVFQWIDGKALFRKVFFEDTKSVDYRWSHINESDYKWADGCRSLLLWYSFLSFEVFRDLSFHYSHTTLSPRDHHNCDLLASFRDCLNLNLIYLLWSFLIRRTISSVFLYANLALIYYCFTQLSV